jgi:hypothetical protein
MPSEIILTHNYHLHGMLVMVYISVYVPRHTNVTGMVNFRHCHLMDMEKVIPLQLNSTLLYKVLMFGPLSMEL